MIEIPLTQNKTALIDKESLDIVQGYKWYAAASGYRYQACSNVPTTVGPNGKMRFRIEVMHRLIWGLLPGDKTVLEHINKNSLDNRMENLRVTTRKQLTQSKSGRLVSSSKYKGVCRYIRKNKDSIVEKWIVHITCNHTVHYVGLYKDEIEAAVAYDNAAKLYFGLCAHLNFPEGITTVI